MFEVNEYKVEFWHNRFNKPVYMFLSNRAAIAETRCAIKDSKKGKQIHPSGIAWCSMDDQFNYNEGRKLALERALENAGFDKPTRTLFWEAYFKKRGKVG